MSTSPVKIEQRPIGERIRLAREFRGLNQQELAAAIGISQSGLCQIERGDTEPRLSTLDAICIVLDFSFDFVPLPLKSAKSRRKK